MLLNTKRHVWQVYFGPIGDIPQLEFTKAKGEAVLEFLNELTRVQKDRVHAKAE